jgi:hypothetical protein
MDLEVIRKTLNERPFRPIVFHLDNGQKQLITDPQFLVTETVVVAVDRKGLPVLMTPESIISIDHQRNPVRRRSKRVATR